MPEKILIHIGKCGGTSCKNAILRSSVVSIDRIVHIRQPPIIPGATYYIIARSPIDRALSAFNWRVNLVLNQKMQLNRFPGEAAILETYKKLNNLAETLYFSDGTTNALAHGNFRSIHHLAESIEFYLAGLLSAICADQIGGVLLQESPSDDLERLFGVQLGEHLHENRSKTPPEMMYLSETALKNLRKFLHRDFDCL